LVHLAPQQLKKPAITKVPASHKIIFMGER